MSKLKGLLIFDHLAKSFIGKLKEPMDCQIEASAPDDQYGGCSGGGTDFPVHIMKSRTAYAAMASVSIIVLFVDLVASYDSAICEIALGLPHSYEAEQVDYLMGFVWSKEIACTILDYIKSGKTKQCSNV